MTSTKPNSADYKHDALRYLDALLEWQNAQPRWRTAWWAIARAVKNAPKMPGQLRGVVVRAWQRMRQGWDFSALYSLDDHLTSTLGAQLVEMATIAHGWPATADFPEFEDWQNALRDNGRKLLAYREREERFRWNSPEYQASIDDAKDALRWVADNLGALWD